MLGRAAVARRRAQPRQDRGPVVGMNEVDRGAELQLLERAAEQRLERLVRREDHALVVNHQWLGQELEQGLHTLLQLGLPHQRPAYHPTRSKISLRMSAPDTTSTKM